MYGTNALVLLTKSLHCAQHTDDDLAPIVAANVMSLNQKFFLRLATRSDSCADTATKERLSVRPQINSAQLPHLSPGLALQFKSEAVVRSVDSS